MRRWLIRIFITACTGIGLLIGALFVRSFWIEDELIVGSGYQDGFTFYSLNRGLHFSSRWSYELVPAQRDLDHTFDFERDSTGRPYFRGPWKIEHHFLQPGDSFIYYMSDTRNFRFGIKKEVNATYEHSDYRALLVSYRVALPHWMLFAVLNIPLCGKAATIIMRRRRQRRSQMNLCMACGYDLRASNDLCPECGTTIPSQVDVPSINSRP
ncbi:MAG TPA: hypothetical protein PK402_05225 [Tepidisphaeraceae bacterium]|nr:hypothetical protein [Tepidisphaeraceae bacterium]